MLKTRQWHRYRQKKQKEVRHMERRRLRPPLNLRKRLFKPDLSLRMRQRTQLQLVNHPIKGMTHIPGWIDQFLIYAAERGVDVDLAFIIVLLEQQAGQLQWRERKWPTPEERASQTQREKERAIQSD